MQDPKDNATADSRRDQRVPIDEEVTIEIGAQNIVGPGKNVSAQGVYFTTTAAIAVRVRFAGRPGAILGELVRVESMGDGTVGVAVRFRS